MDAVKISYRTIPICPDAKAESEADGSLRVQTAAPMPAGSVLGVALGGGKPSPFRVVHVEYGREPAMRLARTTQETA